MKKKLLIWLLVGLCIPITAFILAKVFTLIHYKCPWRYIFHLLCAGCGVTRMVKSIFKLELYNAFLYNPLFFIVGIIGIIYYVYILICILLNKKIIKPNKCCIIVILIVLILFMILRNIPGTFLYDIWP